IDGKIYNVSLNGDSSVSLHWKLDYSSDTIIFEVHLPSHYGWFAIGFSDRGKLFPADYCLLWKNEGGKFSLQDTYADDHGVLHLDRQQDCDAFKSVTRNDVIKFTYRRKFDTCDRRDYVIEYESNIQHTSHGLVHHMEVFHCEAPPNEEIPLYIGNCFAKERPPKTQVCKRVLAAWAMGAPPFAYPKEAALPIGGENFNPYIMLEVHYNNPEHRAGFIDSSGVRFYVSTKLRKMDAGVIELGLEYTDKMAIPPGQESFPLTGYCTSACTSMGTRFESVETLKAKVTEVLNQLTEADSQHCFQQRKSRMERCRDRQGEYIEDEKVDTSLPPQGIVIFGSQLHTHLTGIRVYTRHFDAYGKELPELNRDNHYSTHFQEIRRLKKPVKVLPGHVLTTRCDYNTEDRTNITLGGFGIGDEMCVNYIHYYPHTDLEVCKSSISDQALRTYFRYMNEWEGQSTSPSKGVSDNYKAIKWNKMRVELLNEVYNEAPLSMQCNMSSGDRFPGYWENAHIPPVLSPLAPPNRRCENIVDYM
ncbi:hypothetical protein NQ318_004313, partial [Aromia moschata]